MTVAHGSIVRQHLSFAGKILMRIFVTLIKKT